MFELLDTRPAVDVQEGEFRRLLGYPAGHVPGERPNELAEGARRYFAAHGRPWLYLREVELYATDEGLRLDGVEFHSPHLLEYLRQAGAVRAVLVAVSAGRSCEERARQLWEESKPDEYFFLEVFGSAVVEHLVASVNGRVCALAEGEGLVALPHCSPGYTGWDISDQGKLFELITRGMDRPFPEAFEVLSSGMLRPKKSLLAVVGLIPRTSNALALPQLVPCEKCSYSPCQYRRAQYRYAPPVNGTNRAPTLEPPKTARTPHYTVNARALRKWARERVRLEYHEDGTVEARFHFDGTTCSNLGVPLAFDYLLVLEPSGGGYTVVRSDCRPAPGDEGHKAMCAFISDGEALMKEIDAEKPMLGRQLHEVLDWERPSVPSGCYCSADSRAHKWGLALEVIHYALTQTEAGAARKARTDSP
jgi:hypothetical protein